MGLMLLAGAVAGSAAGWGWVRTWFYQIAWWGYILIIDGLIQWRRGNSLLIDRRSTFWLMCLVSATFWFGWELVNLRLHNWRYLGVESQIWLRWPGAFIAFATVLPGIFSTYELLGVLGLNWSQKVRPLAWKHWQPWFIAIGVIFFALPLLWPRLFFPLVWGALIFLLEPLNFRYGAKSLMGFWQKGDLSPFFRLLAAGLFCGFIWESLNFLSGARWEYTIPYLNQPKLFAMPLAGYGGFPPFAVECYVFFASVSLLRQGRGWEVDDHQQAIVPALPRTWAWVLVLAMVVFDLVILRMMDRYLVKGWAS
jgi:hypothetical protein